MILLEIDPGGVGAVKLGGDAPRSIHMDSVAGWLETLALRILKLL
jgi:hypothetical protein